MAAEFNISRMNTAYEDLELARGILAACLENKPWSEADLDALIKRRSPLLFSVIAEGLSDRFEPRLVEEYVAIFARVLAAVLPGQRPVSRIGETSRLSPGFQDLVARYARVRRVRPCTLEPATVFVLSRVTLGADVAVTSVMLDGLKRRFPGASIVFAGLEKSYGLFSADERIRHLPVSYGRGGAIEDRIAVCPALDDARSIVVDPDSRITQLGLLPVCAEENYFLFESRTYGGSGTESLGELARRWIAETFGVDDARAGIAPAERPEAPEKAVAASLGVGGNPAKRVADPFEARLFAGLAARGRLVVDQGAGGEEAERVARALTASGAGARAWCGSFAGFASVIARSRLYAGYDSAGQHVAAACAVPLVSVFASAPCERFRWRWRPTGPGPSAVIDADGLGVDAVVEATLAGMDRVAGT